MKKANLRIVVFLMFLTIVSCSSDDGETVKSSEKDITSFLFLAVDNEALTNDVTAVVNQEEKTITAGVPPGTDVTALTPTIGLSAQATVNPANKTATNFSAAVTYTVTAEDESTAGYVVTVREELTEREALVAFYEANPNNTLGWDLSEEDISLWEGVTVSEGKVTVLKTDNKNITVIPETIKFLPDLTELNLFFNQINEVPVEIGELTNLRRLLLQNNNINELPAAIKTLQNLEYLGLSDNGLTSLPEEIKDLTSLRYLYLTNNGIPGIPEEIFQLTTLEELFMAQNQITEISAEIGNLTLLTQLRFDNNLIETVPSEIGSFTRLRTLHLNGNNLTTVPVEITQLIALNRLWLQNNDLLTSIPQAICDMDIDDFQKDNTAVCE